MAGINGSMAHLSDGLFTTAIAIYAAAMVGYTAEYAFGRVGRKLAAPAKAAASRELVGAGGPPVPVATDVRDPRQVEAMVATAVDRLGRLDVAHNNAGVPGPYRPLWEYTEDEFAAVLAVDLVGVWRCLKYEARHMTARRAGSIVNTSSMLGLVGMADNAAYTAAKHGVHGLTRSAAGLRFGASRVGDGAVVAIGNAPTAVDEALRLVEVEGWRPACLVGIPVGFVGVRR